MVVGYTVVVDVPSSHERLSILAVERSTSLRVATRVILEQLKAQIMLMILVYSYVKYKLRG